jgi:hypothetical protein
VRNTKSRLKKETKFMKQKLMLCLKLVVVAATAAAAANANVSHLSCVVF